MKTIILAGGQGTRLSEETVVKAKPMVEIGDKPILVHIMNIYASYGFKEFIVALGYKGEMIKEYFLNHYHHACDIVVNLKTGKVEAKNDSMIDWIVHLVDTGKNTLTGGRLMRLKDYVGKETFMLTYGDGLSNVNIKRLLDFHQSHGKTATVMAVRPTARFGGIVLNNDKVSDFKEKSQIGEGWINGGFFVFEPKIFNYLHGDETVLEGEPMENLVKNEQLMAYRHEGFWQCMDTLRDKQNLEKMWESGNAPWAK